MTFTVDELELQLRKMVAERVRRPLHEIDGTLPLRRFGLESIEVAAIADELQNLLAISVPESFLLERETLRAAAEHLSGQLDPVKRASPAVVDHANSSVRKPGKRVSLKARVNDLLSGGKILSSAPWYGPPLQQLDDAWATIDGRRVLLLNSYSYLGLQGHPQIERAAQEALHHFGTGSHGSRLVSGTTTMHLQLEERLAKVKGTEAAMIFGTGFLANLGTITALVGPGDVVITDEYNHTSLADGCRLSGATVLTWRHGDMADLEHCLRSAPGGHVLVVADAVYSMEGDILDLPKVSALCREYGASLMVDEAHSFGVLGKSGTGIIEHFDLPSSSVDIQMGTLSKALPSVGGYIAGSRDMIDAIRRSAHTYIFTGAPSPVQVAAAQAALDLLLTDSARVDRLRQNTVTYLEGLKKLGFDTFSAVTPIVPIRCPTTEICQAFARGCWEKGLNVRCLPGEIFGRV